MFIKSSNENTLQIFAKKKVYDIVKIRSSYLNKTRKLLFIKIERSRYYEKILENRSTIILKEFNNRVIGIRYYIINNDPPSNK